MSGYNELDDILISLRQRREENEAGESAAPEVPPKAKSRVQRAAEEAERQRLEQERLRKKREEERKAQEEKERRERELREKEMRERLERERKAREEAERERQRKKELERAQLELQHAQWRAAQAKLKEEQEKERQKLLEEEAQKEEKEEPNQSKDDTKPSKTEDGAKSVSLKKENYKSPIDEPEKNDEQAENDENKAVNNLPESLPDDNNAEAENNEEPLSPPKDDKKAAKKAAKRAKLEAELLARRLKAEEKQRKKDERKRLKKEKQQELAPPEHKDEKSDGENSESDELNLTVDEKTAENLNTDSVPEPTDKAIEPIEKTDNEDLTENAEHRALPDGELEDGFVWYKSVEHKSPKKSIKERFSPKRIKSVIKKSINAVFVKPFVFVTEMFRDEIFPAAGHSFKKMLTKQFAIFLAVVVAIGAAGYGGCRLYEYSRVAYLNSYKKEFPDVEFPEGILEEMCGEYGKNQNVVCKISPNDKDAFIVATSDKEDDYAYAYPNFDVKNEQQFQSIDVSNADGFDDLESLYSTRDAFLESSQMYELTTLYSKSNYRVIASFYTNTVATDDAGYVFPYNCYGNMTEKSFRSYVDKIKSRRLYDTGYNFSYDDKFLTLSVDSDFMPNFKFVVLCVKNTQKNTEKSTTAIDNESVHYPQAWYDKNGETNPYRFSSNWYPEIYTDDNTNTKRLTGNDFQ